MISSNHKKTRWIRWIRKVSFEMMIFVIILTPKSQGFSPWWFWGSLNSRRKPHQSWIAQGIPSPGLDGTYEPCIGTSRVQRTDQLHLTTVAPVRSWWIVSSTVLLKKNQPNYGTSHPDCGSIQRWQKKILRQSLPALLCRSTAGMRNNIGTDPVKKSTAVGMCAGHHNLLWIQHHQRRTNDKWLTNQLFSKSRGNSPTTTPGTRNEEPE